MLFRSHFPTIDPKDPYALTPEEQKVLEGLQLSFLNCDKLQHHVDFLYKKGAMYRYYNGVLMFHGCIPMEADGSFTQLEIYGVKCRGRSLFDRCEELVRQGRYSKDETLRRRGADFMWYLWCGSKSPLFGKDKMATFERYFLAEKETHVEEKGWFFKLRDKDDVTAERMADTVLDAFGVTGDNRHIINGHVPVHVKKGESPIKANGKLMVIDGGFAEPYHKETGIAGYTLVYHSREFELVQHEPFTNVDDAVREGRDIKSTTQIVATTGHRLHVADTDRGRELQQQIEDLRALLYAYRHGLITESKG